MIGEGKGGLKWSFLLAALGCVAAVAAFEWLLLHSNTHTPSCNLPYYCDHRRYQPPTPGSCHATNTPQHITSANNNNRQHPPPKTEIAPTTQITSTTDAAATAANCRDI